VLLHPSVIERFTAHAPGMSGAARRTLRTNLRFLARAVVPRLDPADQPLPRQRARKPYTPAEIDGYLALALAQPTPGRRARATALVCLGAGAGLIRSDLRQARGSDVVRRPGGVVVTVRGGRAPRTVPVLARYHAPLLLAAAFAGQGFLTGGDKPERGNITNPLTRSLAGGARPAAPGHQPAAGHLAGRDRGAGRPGDVPARRRDLLLPAARRHHRRPGPRQRSRRDRPADRPGPVTP
jgi:integrase